MKKLTLIPVILILVLVVIYLFSRFMPSTSAPVPVTPTTTPVDTPEDVKVSVLTENLKIPWALVFLPNQNILLTERSGVVKLIKKSDPNNPSTVLLIDDVSAVGEGGLLGIATHPDFEKNNFVYVYYTYSAAGDSTMNKVVRYTYNNERLGTPTTIISEIPGNVNHNGGRIKFGPDNFLYITTGDAQEPSLAQDTNEIAGKILRVTDEGKPVSGNPFNNTVYSYGHRNPQGLAWDASGRLWETEHGSDTKDEVNLITLGENYGWPVIRGDVSKDGMELPIIHSNNSTWAPSGLAYHDGYLYFAGLRGAALYRARINGDSLQLEEFFKLEYGRLRDVVVGPDGLLYVTTNNTDGRGSVRKNDDKILVINPKLL